MRRFASRALLVVCMVGVLAALAPVRVQAAEIWVPPTSQQDFGGLEVASAVFWPVTPFGVVRMAWSIPADFDKFTGARIALIPSSPAASTLKYYLCTSKNHEDVAVTCNGPYSRTFDGAANQLIEVDVSEGVALQKFTGGSTYVTLVAYTTPSAATDHIVGLRFGYSALLPAGVATLGSNTFTGTQTAAAFVGSGAGLTNLPPGPPGPPGAPGTPGADGTNGVSGYVRQTVAQTFAAGLLTQRQVTCPTGKKALSGGFHLLSALTPLDRTKIQLLESYPDSDTSWIFWLYNGSANSADFLLYVVCATAP